MKKLSLVCLLFIATNAFSQAVATVLFSSSNAVANHNGAKISLSRGSSLAPGDAISTPDGGQVNIKYINGTLVNIGPNSNYKILAYSPNPADVQIKAQLTSGSISSTTNGKTKESLKTPVMALAILGTKYSVFVKSKTQTYVAVTEGHVRAGNTLLGPGDSILITPNGIINTPFPAQGTVGIAGEQMGSEEGGELRESTSSSSIESSGDDMLGFINSSTVVGEAVGSDLQGMCQAEYYYGYY